MNGLNFTRRTKVRLISFFAALLLISICAGYSSSQTRGDIARAEAERSEALYKEIFALSESLSEIEGGLHTVANLTDHGGRYSAVSKISRACGEARRSVEVMGKYMELSPQLDIYLAQAAEYPAALLGGRRTASALSEEEQANLSALLRFNTELRESLAHIISDYEAGKLVHVGEDGGDSNFAAASPPGALFEGGEGYPELYYDGAHSAHLLGETLFAGTFGLREVSPEAGKKSAGDFIGVPAEDIEYVGLESGGLDIHRYTYRDISIGVTKAGGIVAEFKSGRKPRVKEIEPEKARELAALFLASKGFEGMTAVSESAEGAKAVLKFAFEENGVVFYPDEISVTVALDKGDVLAFDCRGYLRSHTEVRAFLVPKIKLEKASGLTLAGHDFVSARYAVILTDGMLEQTCVEVTSTKGGDGYRSYFDAADGREIKIVKVS